RIIRGVNLTVPSPLWLRERLRRGGIRPINLAVDVTNLVMLELGKPMHAFDLDHLQGGIAVRHAQPGECLTLLDGSVRDLQAGTLVIADSQGPLALAGIMGGQHSGVSAETRDVLLEAA